MRLPSERKVRFARQLGWLLVVAGFPVLLAACGASSQAPTAAAPSETEISTPAVPEAATPEPEADELEETADSSTIVSTPKAQSIDIPPRADISADLVQGLVETNVAQRSTVLDDGRVITFGGSQQGLELTLPELFEPSTGTWAVMDRIKLIRAPLPGQ